MFPIAGYSYEQDQQSAIITAKISRSEQTNNRGVRSTDNVLTGLKHFLGRNKAQTHTGQGKYTKYPKMLETQIYQQTRQNDVKVLRYIHLRFFSSYFLSKSH